MRVKSGAQMIVLVGVMLDLMGVEGGLLRGEVLGAKEDVERCR